MNAEPATPEQVAEIRERESCQDAIDAVNERLANIIGRDDPAWRIAEIRRNLPTRSRWKKYDYEDFYLRDVMFLTTLADWHDARIDQLEAENARLSAFAASMVQEGAGRLD